MVIIFWNILDHDFIIAALEKFGFKSNLIDWIKIFLNKQESCVISGGVTTQYFRSKRAARQGDPMSAYLFISCLESLFIFIKNNENIESVSILKIRICIKDLLMILDFSWKT